MEPKKDNIDKLVKPMLETPGLTERTLRQIRDNTEQSYLAFRDVRDRHTDIGRAALPAMLRNQSTHVVRNVVEHTAKALAQLMESEAGFSIEMLADHPEELYRILVNSGDAYNDAVFDTATILAPQFQMFDDRYNAEKVSEFITEFDNSKE
jgi:hypothetical protein